MILLLLLIHSVSARSDWISEAWADARAEMLSHFPAALPPNTIQARNLSIAALAAIKLSKMTRDFDRPFHDDRLPRELCPLGKYRCSAGKYRHMDGRCTNLLKPLDGSKMSPFSRQLPPQYDDDVNSARLQNLPPVDVISKIFDYQPSSRIPLTSYFIDFSEFLHQDMAQLAKFHDSISCCNSEKSEECINFGTIECYARSAPSPLPKCSFGRREQMNLATSFLDAGPIYEHIEDITKGKINNHILQETNSIQQILIADHNHVAEQLSSAFPTLSDEEIFEESRKFQIAQLQLITFEHFLPILLGEQTIHKYLHQSITSNIPSSNTLNEVLIAGVYHRFMQESSAEHSGIIHRPILGGSHLAELLMLGRDHGHATYAKWREECGGGRIRSFDELTEMVDESILKQLRRLFQNVDDVDLLLLGLAENPVYGSVLGPTFGCILALQFQKIKFGDSYWYETILNDRQIAELRKTSLSAILCRNSKRDTVSKNAFSIEDAFTNIPVSCNSSLFPKIDFRNWISFPKQSEKLKLSSIIDQCVRRVNNRWASSINLKPGVHNSMALKSYGSMMLAKDEAVAEANISFILLEATRHLPNLQGVQLSLTVPGNTNCNPKPLPCDPTNPFRSYTGWCNNIENPHWATTFGELKRVLKPVYEDLIDSPRSNRNLPSPRLVSNIVHFGKKIEHSKYSHFLMEFGQFIDHDITHSPVDQNPDGTPLNCSRCDSANTVSPSCFPIAVPFNDPVFPPQSCLSFVRSLPAQKTLGYRNQMNQISAYLDGSVIYGSTKCEGDRLRTFDHGRMATTQLRKTRSHYGITLPQSDESEQDGCVSSPEFPCFIAGDDRNSQQTLLIAVHSVFHREHERIADRFGSLNPHWDDERVYQETRRLIGAQFAHIVYSEYLPIIIGQKLMDIYDLRPKIQGYYDRYDAQCDASILQPFATAAFRFGHSTVARYTPINNDVDVVDLGAEFLNMTKIYSLDESVEGILGGMHHRRQMATDRHIDDAVRNFLFSDRGKLGTGLDLIAINIQRGRDHGIAPYNRYREWCGLDAIRSFHSIFADIEPDALKAMSKVYESVEDIDLFTGIVSEKPVDGGIVGPTAACIIAEQFRRLKKCDRFYYETSDPYLRFTEQQLNEIRKIRMSSLICANTKVRKIARDVFSTPDDFLNTLVDCRFFEQIDLSKWRESENCLLSDNQKIKIHESRKISPCTSCTCTLEGLKCISIPPDCSEYSKEEIEKDAICLMQCAFKIKK